MAKNSYKLLVVDIDGTLVGRDGKIRAEDKEALARARSAGIAVSLSTGRAVTACSDIIRELDLNGYHMFCDGALVCDLERDEEVYAQPLDEAVFRQAVDFARVNRINIEFHSRDGYFVEKETWSTIVRRYLFGVSPMMVDFANLGEQERIIKGSMTAVSSQEVAKARHFHNEFGDRLYFSWVTTPSYPEVSFINVVAPGVTKGKALNALTAHLEITLEEVIAIGDGDNDISLLATAGLGIAMGNATGKLKDVSDRVTLDVECGGISAAVNEFLL
ncbi:Cof-type HAD-IIB family hydrolase [Chloroflexota bacterium]